MTRRKVSLPFEDVQKLFDMCVSSLDFGSGFLDTEDVECLRKVAEILGVDPALGTPSEFRDKYPHPANPDRNEPERCKNWGCGKPVSDPIHIGSPA